MGDGKWESLDGTARMDSVCLSAAAADLCFETDPNRTISHRPFPILQQRGGLAWPATKLVPRLPEIVSFWRWCCQSADKHGYAGQ